MTGFDTVALTHVFIDLVLAEDIAMWSDIVRNRVYTLASFRSIIYVSEALLDLLVQLIGCCYYILFVFSRFIDIKDPRIHLYESLTFIYSKGVSNCTPF